MSHHPQAILNLASGAGSQRELSRAQRNAEALDELSAAFDTYVECEAIADGRRVGRALRRLGVERRVVTPPRARTGWDSLTDSELTVVNLIAEGATNRSSRAATAPVPSHGENASTQCVRQARHHLSGSTDPTHAPLGLTSPSDSGH
jgi:hypothetical protein